MLSFHSVAPCLVSAIDPRTYQHLGLVSLLYTIEDTAAEGDPAEGKLVLNVKFANAMHRELKVGTLMTERGSEKQGHYKGLGPWSHR